MPKIYVADLAEYNAGRQRGKWIDVAGMDADEIEEVIQSKVLKKGHEEWAIHDHEGFAGIDIDEYENLATIAALSEAIERVGDAFGAYYASQGFRSVDAALRSFEDAYQGQWDNEEAFVENLLEDTGMLDELPGWARPYFDVERYTRDLFMGDYFSISAGPGEGVYVFASV